MTWWLVSIIEPSILYCCLYPSQAKLLPNSLYPQVAAEAISNFTSAATGWQVVSNTSYYKHGRWRRADTASERCGTVSDGHSLPALSSTTVAGRAPCVSRGDSCSVCVCVLKSSATLRPSQYLFKTPELCFSLTLPVYIGSPLQTHTHTFKVHHYEGMQAVRLPWVDRTVFHFDEWLYYQQDNIRMFFGNLRRGSLAADKTIANSARATCAVPH